MNKTPVKNNLWHWLWVSVALTGAISIFLQTPMRNSDSRYLEQLAKGEAIFTQGSLYLNETFSWSLPHRFWVDAYWLSDLIHLACNNIMKSFYADSVVDSLRFLDLLLALCGALGVIILCDLIFSDDKTLGLFEGMPELSDESKKVLFCLAVGIYLLFSLSSNTINFFSIAILPYLLFCLLRKKSKDLLIIFVLATVWSNLELQFFVLPLIVAFLLIQAVLQKIKLDIKFYFLALMLILLASCINPLGYGNLLNVLIILFNQNNFVKEIYGFKSPDFHEIPIYALGVGLLMANVAWSAWRLAWQWIALLILGLLLLFLSKGNQALFALVLSLTLSCTASNYLERLRVYSRKFYLFATTAAILAITLLTAYESQALGSLSRLQLGDLDSSLKTLESQIKERGEGLRVFNDLRLSGDLIQKGVRVFIDSRGLLYQKSSSILGDNESILEDYTQILRLKQGWEEVFKKWEFDAAILDVHSSLANILIELAGWKELARGPLQQQSSKGRIKPMQAILLIPPDV